MNTTAKVIATAILIGLICRIVAMLMEDER